VYNSQSRYCYPGTSVLINKEDLRDQVILSRFENTATTLRGGQLKYEPIYGNFDLKHVQKIHGHLFQDVYPFAGKLRTENIAKGSFSFCSSEYIPSAAKELFSALSREKYLVNLALPQFAERAAHYMAEINVLHPFREGNGRTHREFIRSLALNAGYELDWSVCDKNAVLQASIKSVTNPRDLAGVIQKSILNETPEAKLSRIFRDQDPDRSR
jgi:cell filamentation protein